MSPRVVDLVARSTESMHAGSLRAPNVSVVNHVDLRVSLDTSKDKHQVTHLVVPAVERGASSYPET